MYIDHDRLNALAARQRAGELTAAEIQAELSGKPLTSSTARITSSGLDDRTLAVRSLVNEFGIPELTAHQSIGTEPHQVPLEAFRDRIAAEDARTVAIMQAESDAAYARTPEGIEQAAEKALLARQQTQRRVQLGRVALEELGVLPADDIASLSDSEILKASGLVQHNDGFHEGANDRTANLRAAGEAS